MDNSSKKCPAACQQRAPGASVRARLGHNHEVVHVLEQRVSMLKALRPRVVAAVLCLSFQATLASAQTVIARNVPAGSTVELVLNSAKIGTATADAAGDAKLPFSLQQNGGRTEMDASVHLEVCPDVRRIVLVERNQTPAPPEVGCSRQDVTGLFLIRRVTNLVVDTGAVNPTVWLRQGPVDLSPKRASVRWDSTPNGLIVFGGAGIGTFRDALLFLCGSVSPCQGGDSRTTYSAGATFWLGPFVGVEGSFLKPAGVNANGTASNFRFNSVQSTRLYVINGKVGIPINRARVYGQGGTNYHRATQTTNETIDDTTVTVNGLIEPVTGGTQKIELKTGGWGWQFGGGLEVWLKPSTALYGEVGRTRLNGEGLEGRQGELKDYLTTFLFGIRLKIRR
jgi:hypothetical protein